MNSYCCSIVMFFGTLFMCMQLQNPFMQWNFLTLVDKFIICSTNFVLFWVKITMYGLQTFLYCDENVTCNDESFIWCANFIICRCWVMIHVWCGQFFPWCDHFIIIWYVNFFICSLIFMMRFSLESFNGEEVKFYFIMLSLFVLDTSISYLIYFVWKMECIISTTCV